MNREQMLLTSAHMAEHAKFWAYHLETVDPDNSLWCSADAGQSGRRCVAVDLQSSTAAAVSNLVGGKPIGVMVVVATALGQWLHRCGMGSQPLIQIPAGDQPGNAPEGNVFLALTATSDSLRNDLRQNRENMAKAFGFSAFPVALWLKQQFPNQDSFTQVALTSHALHRGDNHLPLQLHITASAPAAKLTLHYDAAVFSAAFIAETAAGLALILDQLSADAGRSGDDLQIWSPQSLTLLTETWAQGPEPARTAATVHETFAALAAQQPDAVAIQQGTEQLTYADLNRRANRIARFLRDTYAVAPGDRVALLHDREPAVVAAMLAVLKCGAAYVPLDPQYPAARLNHILAETEPTALITQSQYMFDVGDFANLFLTDVMEDAVAMLDDSDDHAASQAASPAYLMYTSGSTGLPKATVIPHRGITRLAVGIPAVDLSRARVLQAAPITFDAATFEIWGPLLRGGTCVLLDAKVPTTEVLAATIAAGRVDTLWLTATLFNTLIDDQAQALASVRFCLVGGEALSVYHVRRAQELLPELTLINGYGPTESTTFTCCHVIARDQADDRTSIPIGRPIAHTRVYVLDGAGRLAPRGVPGQLAIAGDGLADGYLNRAELTQSRFVTRDLPTVAGTPRRETLYLSGDRVMWREDGTLAFLGRLDNQIKLRGYRIEPGEIEQVLCQVDGVKRALVVPQREGERVVALAAYLEVADPAGVDEQRVRQELAERLPAYMAPTYLIALAQFPATANGKIDVAGLPDPKAQAAPEARYQAPRDETEQLLADIWEVVLDHSPIGIHDNFFQLGGDSLRAIQVLSRLQKVGVHAEIQDIFENLTIAELAPQLTRGEITHQATGPFDLISEEDRRHLPPSVTAAYPLSRLQEGMIYHAELGEQVGAYHDVISYQVKAPFLPELLQETFAVLSARHPALRVFFDLNHYTEALQLVSDEVTVPVHFIDLRDQSEESQEREIERFVETEHDNPFAWHEAPLFRVFIHRRAEDRFQLSISISHAIIDGWSLSSLISEWMGLYEALIDGETPSRNDDPNHGFREFIALERAALANPESRRFWTERLADAQVLRIPRLPEKTLPSAPESDCRLFIKIEEPTTRALFRVADQAGTSIKAVLLAAHLRVLHLCSGHDDVLTGLIANGRPESGDADTSLGLFLNTIPFRQSIGGGSWLDLIRATYARENEALPHRRYPLPAVMRDLNMGELFETAFNYINFHAYDTIEQYKHVSLMSGTGFERSNFTLTATFHPYDKNREIMINLEYDPAVIDQNRINEIGAYYRTVLEAVVAHPEGPVAYCELLGRDERYRILEQFSRGPRVRWNEVSVCERFAAVVAQQPGAVAVATAGEDVTYAELDQRAEHLADQLAARGIKAEDAVGICVHRSVDMVAAVLAVLKLGAVYVPIDPTYPVRRIEYMVGAGNLALLLTNADLWHLPFDGSVPTLCMRDLLRAEAVTPAVKPALNATAPAYIIFTSGSTGQPKGVRAKHGGLLNLALSQIELFSVTSKSRVAQFSSFSFDASVSELFVTLCAGATLVLPSGDEILAGDALADFLREQRISVVTLPPSVLATLPEQQRFPDLAVLVSAGEACPQHLVARWGATRRFINAYGPTELTVCATAGTLQPEGELHIGTPMTNTDVFILDKFLQPTPVGAPGELYLGGDGLTLGYLNRADLNLERLVPSPFNPGERLYKSGDLGRFLPDGTIEYLGRIDHQVKIRGFRVELNEIDLALDRHPAVSGAVTVALPHGDDRRLTAYLICPGEQPDAQTLRSFLSDYLPAFMIPSQFLFLERFPRTPNGKLDLAALPKPQADTITVTQAPRNPNEEVLHNMWCAVLGTSAVGIHQDFFELGGHSLSATRLVSRIREVFGHALSLREFFAAPTIAALATKLAQTKGAPPPPLTRRDDHGPAPLSFPQKRLWFLTQYEENSSAYHIPLVFRLHGRLDRDALANALQQIVDRHEILRTRIVTLEGEPFQVILKQETLNLPLTRVSGADLIAREEAARARITAANARPFDLAEQAPFRAELFQLADDDHLLWVNFHHICSDGWSTGLFIGEWTELYRAALEQRPAALPDLTIQYADYAAWMVRCLEAGEETRQANYWRNHLADATPHLALPTDFARPAVKTYNGAAVDFELDQTLRDKLQQLSLRHGTSLFMTLLTLFKTLLFRYTGQADITVGTPVHGRHRSELETLLGMFLNNLILHSRPNGNLMFADYLDQVRGVTLDAFAHGDIPFERLVDLLEVPRDQSTTPVFQAVFVLQNTPGADLALPDLTMSGFDVANPTAKYDLTLAMADIETGIPATFEYNSDLFTKETIERLVGHFKTLIAAVCESPYHQLSALPLLGEAEQRLLTETWPGQAQPFIVKHTLVDRFEQAAAAHADRIAVRDDQTALTYTELNARANRIAHVLRDLGVAPNDHVGLCLERGVDLAVAIVAILKAGAGYVPIDPAYPAARADFIAADAGLTFLLTNRTTALPFGDQPATTAIYLEDLAGETRDTNPDPVAQPDDLAYIIYTSGSTGTPKGALLKHENVVALFDASSEHFRFDADQVWTLFHSYAFDFSVWELWGALLYGGLCRMVGYETSRNPEAMLHLLADEGVTVLSQTPSAFAQLIQADARLAARDGRNLPLALQNVVFGGEALDPAGLRDWIERRGDGVATQGPALINMYGITETCVHVTVRRITAADAAVGNRSPIGQALPHLQHYVLDPHLNPAPIGVVGELYIAGAGLARGYLNRGDLTAARFVPHPFSRQPGARLYRTGDLARTLPDGSLDFAGRCDHQVKIRGFRIELGEIEHQLQEHPAVSGAHVRVHGDDQGNKRLIAYCTVAAGEPLEGAELRAFLATRLSDYMIPARFFVLDSFPLTAHGKLDTGALPRPGDDDQAATADSDAAPRQGLEAELAAIWAEVLQVNHVGRNDNFFELGGDSILSIQVIARARQAGIKLTGKDMFSYQTVGELAPVAAARGGDVATANEPLSGAVALTPIQRWFLEKPLQHRNQWNQALVLQPAAALDADLLAKALQRVAVHHDGLRLRFTETAQGWQAQYAAPGADFPLSQSRDDAPTAAFAAAQTSLNLGNGPIARAVLWHAPEGQRLLLAVHHLAIDAVSWGILLRDLETCYHAYRAGDEPRLPAKTDSYARWSQQLHQLAAGHEVGDQAAFWRDYLAGVTPLQADHPDAADCEADLATIDLQFERDQTTRLRDQVAQNFGTKIHESLAALAVQALAQWQGGCPALDIEIHGREDLFPDQDLSRTVGWFTAMVPLRASAGATVGEALINAKEHLRGLPRAGLDHGLLRYLRAHQDPNPCLTQAAQVSFNFLGDFSKGLGGEQALLNLVGDDPGPVHHQHDPRGYAIDIAASIADGCLQISLMYSQARWQAASINRLADHLRDLIDTAVATADADAQPTFSPTDFPLAEMDQNELGALFDALEQ